jgi:translocation and assembly module TamA
LLERLREALPLALWFVLAALAGGCAQLPGFGGTAAGAPAEPPPPPQFRLEVDAPSALRDLLLQHLDLARLQHAAAADALTRGEIDRLIGAAAAQARSLLETEGYFNPEVAVRRVDDGGALPLLRMTVQPGPRALVDRLTLEVQGGLQDEAARGDPRAEALLRTLQAEWALAPGEPFRQAAWDGAKNRVLATLRSNGYLSAQWSGTAAQVNADKDSVRLFLVADSGALFRVGAIRTAGLQRFDEAAVLPAARELVGKPATEMLIRDVQDRILSLGLFESVVIDVDATAPDPAHAPALLAIRELSAQQATVGIGYADDTGFQATLEHANRRLFGTRWVALNKLQVGQTLNSWTGDLISHLQDDGWRTLFAGQAERLDNDDEIRTSWYARAGRTRDTVRIWRLAYGEYAAARLSTAAGVNDSDALSANYHWVWRDVDDLRTPTFGTVWSLQGAAGYARGTTTSIDSTAQSDDAGPFGRLYGRVQGYLPLGHAFYGSARLELGQVIVQESLAVPDTLLFRAGGDDSVRGYAYRSLAPELGGVTVGGTTLLTASLQVARPIFADRPEFLWAAFVDAGNAADSWGSLRPALGYGVGLHWRSPVGPLRADLAYGQEVRKFRLHFSVGVVF